MKNSEMGGNTKEKVLYGDAAGTSGSPPQPQAPNENNKVENPPTRNAVSGTGFVDSTSKLAEQLQAAKPDMGPNFEQNILDPMKLRRIMSNRLSAKRSRLKNIRLLADLEIQSKTFEDQIADLQSQQAYLQEQKQFLMVEEQTLEQEMEVLQKETLLRDAEIEKSKAEVIRLRELQAMQQEKLQAKLRNWNIGLLDPGLNDPISNQVVGNGVETSYIPPEPSQMQIPAVPNVQETNLTPPNCMGSMDMNNISETALNPK